MLGRIEEMRNLAGELNEFRRMSIGATGKPAHLAKCAVEEILVGSAHNSRILICGFW